RTSEGGEGAKYRELAQVPARLASVANRRAGGCELIVAPVAPRSPSTSSVRESPWAGMSGGPVFAGMCLRAVGTDHHEREGLGRLSAVRLDLILAALDVDTALRMLPLLGIRTLEDLRPADETSWQEEREHSHRVPPNTLPCTDRLAAGVGLAETWKAT